MRAVKSTALIGLVILCGVVRCVAAEPAATIIDYGRYASTVTGLKPKEGVSGSVEVAAKDFKLVETTKKIPCKVGEAFGFRCRLSGLPQNQAFTLRTEMHHPPIKQPGGETLTKSVSSVTYRAGTRLGDWVEVWHFIKGFEYELVPGTWTKKVFVDNKEVTSVSFTVVQ